MLISKQRIFYTVENDIVESSFRDFLLDFWKTLQPFESDRRRNILRHSHDFSLPDVVVRIEPTPRRDEWDSFVKQKTAFAYINAEGKRNVWFPQRLMVVPENEHDIGTLYRIKL